MGTGIGFAQERKDTLDWNAGLVKNEMGDYVRPSLKKKEVTKPLKRESVEAEKRGNAEADKRGSQSSLPKAERFTQPKAEPANSGELTSRGDD